MLVARLNDQCQGFCAACECPMSGRIVTGANTVLTNKLPTAKLYSIVQGNCGHIGYLFTSSKNLPEKVPFGRYGDTFQGVFSGQVVLGSENVWSK